MIVTLIELGEQAVDTCGGFHRQVNQAATLVLEIFTSDHVRRYDAFVSQQSRPPQSPGSLVTLILQLPPKPRRC